jgi:hypothetical protein
MDLLTQYLLLQNLPKLPRRPKSKLIAKGQSRDGQWFMIIGKPIWNHLARVASETKDNRLPTILYSFSGSAGLGIRRGDAVVLVLPAKKGADLITLKQVMDRICWALNSGI